MNTAEALAVLQERARSFYLQRRPLFQEAVKLGIAALQEKRKREQGEQP